MIADWNRYERSLHILCGSVHGMAIDFSVLNDIVFSEKTSALLNENCVSCFGKSVLSNWKLCREIKEGIVLVVQWYWFMDLVNDEMFPELCVKCQKLCVNVNRWRTNIICKRAKHQCCSPRNLVNFLGEHAATMLFVFLVHRDLADLARRYMHT